MSVFNRFFWSCSSSSAWSIRYNLVHNYIMSTMLMMALVKMSEVKTQRPLSLGIHPVFQDHLLLNPLVNGIDNTMKNASDDLRFFDESHVAIIVPYRNHCSGFSS